MRISFLGAAREVTGSCYVLETDRSRVLIDCGAFQGGAFVEAKNFQPFGFDPSTIDAVMVTHAHLDHVGRLPKLVKEGFRGKIYMTPPTIRLTKLVLEDAYQIMQEDFERDARSMLYEEKDMLRAASFFTPLDYDRPLSLDGVSFRFSDAGHIFGSAFVDGEERGGPRVTFSGDVGNERVPILRDTSPLMKTDVLVTESTYGNRIHEDESTRTQKLRDAIERTIQERGVLIIPAFAIERTQQILYEIHRLIDRQQIPRVDAYLDSPMAIKATKIIEEFPQYYDIEALKEVSMGENMLSFPGLVHTPTREDSKTINDAPKPKVIIAGSGMMNGGRILHHLLRYVSDPRSTVLIIGYQAEGTLGRRLYRGEKVVTVLGERLQVKARVLSIGAYSAHADQNKLVRWIGQSSFLPKQVYCTHGEEGAAVALATRLKQDLGIHADVPRFGDVIQI